MEFLVRMRQPVGKGPLLVGRVGSAAEALCLVREWRDSHPDAWAEITRVDGRPSASAG